MTDYLTPFDVHVDATFIAWVLAGLLLGGAPISYFIARLKGCDLASEGAALAGFSAVAQVFGTRWAFIVLFADAGKAMLLVRAALRFLTTRSPAGRRSPRCWAISGPSLVLALGVGED